MRFIRIVSWYLKRLITSDADCSRVVRQSEAWDTFGLSTEHVMCALVQALFLRFGE